MVEEDEKVGDEANVASALAMFTALPSHDGAVKDCYGAEFYMEKEDVKAKVQEESNGASVRTLNAEVPCLAALYGGDVDVIDEIETCRLGALLTLSDDESGSDEDFAL